MTLGQFADVVGAPRRWVQNALAVLGAAGTYDAERAKRLGLARLMTDTTGMPLTQSYPLAVQALAVWPAASQWTHASADGAVEVRVDVERYLSAFATRLSHARSSYAERRRGRRPRRSRDAIGAARRYGVDVSLIDESLSLDPAARLARLDGMADFFRSARVVRREASP